MSIMALVVVVAAEARCVIEGPSEKFVRAGSQLRLACHIDQCTSQPEFMFWYKDGIMVNYDREGVYQVSVGGWLGSGVRARSLFL